MPDNYTRIIVYGLVIFMAAVIALCFIIEVPETVIAEVRVTSINPPTILKAQTNGKIHFLFDNYRDKYKKGTYLAVMENSANYEDVQFLHKWLTENDIHNKKTDVLEILEKPMNLGELESAFHDFKMACVKYNTLYSSHSSYTNTLKLLEENKKRIGMSIDNNLKTQNIYNKELKIREYYITSDSILFKKNATNKDNMDNSVLQYIQIEKQLANISGQIDDSRQAINETDARIRQAIDEEMIEKTNASIMLNDTYNTLLAQIAMWERNYVFKVPGDSHIELANVLSNQSFVTVGEPIFNVIYDNSKYYGVGILPSTGAGEVKAGNAVKVNMELYPYQEYGSLEGIIKSVSRSSLDRDYLIYIDLPKGLESDNGNILSFAETMYGQAEIITEKKLLFFKLFNRFKEISNIQKRKALKKDNSDSTEGEEKTKKNFF